MVMGGVSKVTKWINHRTTSYRVQLWISTIKTIQGRFGTAVASYFIVNRWVFLMNITLAMLWFFLVVLQGILDMEKPVVFPNGQVNVNNITHWDAFKFEKLDARGNVINTPFDFFTGDVSMDIFIHSIGNSTDYSLFIIFYSFRAYMTHSFSTHSTKTT